QVEVHVGDVIGVREERLRVIDLPEPGWIPVDRLDVGHVGDDGGAQGRAAWPDGQAQLERPARAHPLVCRPRRVRSEASYEGESDREETQPAHALGAESSHWF